MSADHSAVDYDYAAGMEGADSHFVFGFGKAEVVGCGPSD